MWDFLFSYQGYLLDFIQVKKWDEFQFYKKAPFSASLRGTLRQALDKLRNITSSLVEIASTEKSRNDGSNGH